MESHRLTTASVPFGVSSLLIARCSSLGARSPKSHFRGRLHSLLIFTTSTMAIHEEYLKTTIQESIHLYNRVSKSKSLAHLTKKNEARIFHLATKQDKKFHHELQECLSKRDHYTNKLNKMLNGLIEKHCEDPEATADPKKPHLVAAAQLDSTHICSRHHANVFLQQMSSTAREELQSLADQHSKFQKYFEGRRRQLIRDPSYTDDQVKEELAKLDAMVYAKQLLLEQESTRTLRALKVPFFSLDPAWEYPGLNEDKVYILEAISEQRCVSETAENRDNRKQSNEKQQRTS